MKTTLLALVVAGCSLSSASAQAFYFGRPCTPAVAVRYASSPGFQLSYSTYYPQVVSYGQPWAGGCYAPVAVPVRYYCPAMVNPCGVVRSYGYQGYRNMGVPLTYRPFRASVANPVFPVRCR